MTNLEVDSEYELVIRYRKEKLPLHSAGKDQHFSTLNVHDVASLHCIKRGLGKTMYGEEIMKIFEN